MTKTRAPLTFENAQAQVAGAIGHDEMVAVAGQSSRTVYDWGDPDNERSAPIAAAVRLDIAHMRAGGVGAPFYETYGQLLEQAHAEAFGDQHELIVLNAEIAREAGEAHGALALCTLPGATPSDYQRATREVEQNAGKLSRVLALLGKLGRPRAPP